MRIYLSGPMTKRVAPDFNRPAFKQAASILRFLDHYVIDPSEQPEDRESYADYMRFDIASIMAVDAVVLLPEWEKGPGAVVEALTAVSVGIPVYTYNNAKPSDPLTLLYKANHCVENIRDILRRADAG